MLRGLGSSLQFVIFGAFYALSFPFKGDYSLFPFSLICLYLFFSKLETLKGKTGQLKSDLLKQVLFCLGFTLAGYYWIPETVRIFGAIPFPINYIVCSIFAFFTIPQFFLALLLVRGLLKIPKLILSPLLLAILYTTLDFFFPQQFPAHPGHTWFPMAPYLKLATFWGVNGYTFLTYFSIFSIIQSLKTKKLSPTFVSFIVLFFGYSLLSPLKLNNDPTRDPLAIRFVQANIGSMQKIASEKGEPISLSEIYSTYEELTTQPSPFPIDLTIWPETSYPDLQSTEYLYKKPELFIPKYLQNILKKSNSHLLLGGYDNNPAAGFHKHLFETQYNSAFLFSPNPLALINSYNKIKLIPFGETLPFNKRINDALSGYIENISFFKQGNKYTRFEMLGYSFITSICYEVLFSDFTATYLNSLNGQPDFMINLTNDSWYGDTSEPLQHLFLAQWRTLEFQLPLIRSTNTGLSSVTFPDGSESKRLQVNEKGVLDLKIHPQVKQKTTYQQIGFLAIIPVCLILFILGLIEKRFKLEIPLSKGRANE